MKKKLLIRLGLALLFCCGMATEKAWSQGGGGGAARAATTYPKSTDLGEASITFDPETRKLIVVTDDETASAISTVVSNLNRPAPQVLIKVVFVEVTYRKGLDIGVEGSYRRTLDNGSATGIVDQAFSGLTGLSSGSGIYQVLSSDYQVTLRAIAEAGKLEVLSRPSILARNNQLASIVVGQRVPLITDTRFDNFGNQINSFAYEDVGIILDVTPFITSAGMVEMIVSPQISSLSEQSVSISSGTNAATSAPVINIRQADTVVVTPDGQTVVIGGLMSTSRTRTESKIPLLGDIPLLGNLFKRKVTGDTKTELLIFLTPHIVQTPAQLASMTSSEAANTQIVPKAFSEEELDRYFDNVPVKGETPPRKEK